MLDNTAIHQKAEALAQQAADLAQDVTHLQQGGGVDPFIFGLTVFVLACFVGYYVVWRVTPALHTPLMSVTNAISGIIIVGAIIALGPEGHGFSHIAGFIAVAIASINIFGGFIVTQRMLGMFQKKVQPSKEKPHGQ
ncbi:MAG: NAD(P) transhydrogenase subunit alpha [Pseudomonadota bacterium]|nr:NAD(P) transhydrogenase subunit alpha [Pseudomonadota bacterium]MDE3038881.1 NAD(P) transhydrogenase subunit alpha [Pseudomonadota bacterium]